MQNGSIKAIEVGVVETDERYRQYLMAIIGGSVGLHNCWACADGKTALSHFARRPPRVALVSLFLRDVAGTQLIDRARRLCPDTSFLMLLPEAHPNLFFEALETGACAYLDKSCSPNALIGAIRTVSEGGAVVSDTMAKIVVGFFRARGSVLKRLTERERHVLLCLCNGLSRLETAEQLGIDPETVRTHVRNLLMKLQAHSSAEAVARYLNPSEPAAERKASGVEKPKANMDAGPRRLGQVKSSSSMVA